MYSYTNKTREMSQTALTTFVLPTNKLLYLGTIRKEMKCNVAGKPQNYTN